MLEMGWETILGILAMVIKTKDLNLKNATVNSINEISKLCDSTQRTHLLAFTLNLMNDQELDIQAMSLTIIKNLLNSLDLQTCEDLILPDIFRLLNSDNLGIQKKALKSLIKLSNKISWSKFESIIYPIFLNLTVSENWIIRKECGKIIGKLAAKISSKEQSIRLLESYYLLLYDKNQTVKKHAQSQLGYFIYWTRSRDSLLLRELKNILLNPDGFNQEIVLFFPSIFRNNCISPDCAVDLLKTLGCVSDSSSRKSLAKIIEFYLINFEYFEVKEIKAIYRDLLRDVDDVKILAISRLPKIIRWFNVEDRLEFLLILKRFQSFRTSIRLKKEVSLCLSKILPFYTTDICVNKIWPILLSFAFDDYWSVRKKAARSLGYFISKLWGSSELIDTIIREKLRDFSHSKSYNTRLIFVWLMKNIRCTDLFQSWLLDYFFQLCEDKVVNVRICCARLVNSKINDKMFVWSRAASILNSDPEWDVISALKTKSWKNIKNSKYLVLPPLIVINKISNEGWVGIYKSDNCEEDFKMQFMAHKERINMN